MTNTFQIRKVMPEGTSSPFISRILLGLLEFKKQLLCDDLDEKNNKIINDNFDHYFKITFEAAKATRDVAKDIQELIQAQVINIQSGKAIQLNQNSYLIKDTIDFPLQQKVSQLIDQSIITTKSGLQNLMKDSLNLNIGFFFQHNEFFTKGISTLNASNHEALALYLKDVRNNWYENLNNLRVKQEHQGWKLDNIEYSPRVLGGMNIILPTVLGMPIDLFVNRTANRVLHFVENMVVYGLLNFSIFKPFFMIEIPRYERDSSNPQRFMLEAKGLSTHSPWVISYQEESDFV